MHRVLSLLLLLSACGPFEVGANRRADLEDQALRDALLGADYAASTARVGYDCMGTAFTGGWILTPASCIDGYAIADEISIRQQRDTYEAWGTGVVRDVDQGFALIESPWGVGLALAHADSRLLRSHPMAIVPGRMTRPAPVWFEQDDIPFGHVELPLRDDCEIGKRCAGFDDYPLGCDAPAGTPLIVPSTHGPVIVGIASEDQTCDTPFPSFQPMEKFHAWLSRASSVRFTQDVEMPAWVEDDHGDSAPLATPVTLVDSIEATLDRADIDAFRLDLSEDTILRAQSTSDLHLDAIILGHDGQLEYHSEGQYDFELETWLPAGNHTLLVKAVDFNGQNWHQRFGSYRLDLGGFADDHGQDETTATELDPEAASIVDGYVTREDRDVFRLDRPTPREVMIRVDTERSLRAWTGPSLNQLTEFNWEAGCCGLFVELSEAEGPLFVVVEPANRLVRAQYTLTVEPGLPAGGWVHGFQEGSPDALEILDVANNASFIELDDDAGLELRAASNIVAARPIASLADLDAVPWVGPVAFEQLHAYANQP